MIKDLWRDGWMGKAMMVFTALLIIAIPFGIYFAVVQHNKWVNWCENQGGHVIDHTTSSTGTGVGADGKPVVTTTSETTYYCLNQDGGIIDIEG